MPLLLLTLILRRCACLTVRCFEILPKDHILQPSIPCGTCLGSVIFEIALAMPRFGCYLFITLFLSARSTSVVCPNKSSPMHLVKSWFGASYFAVSMLSELKSHLPSNPKGRRPPNPWIWHTEVQLCNYSVYTKLNMRYHYPKQLCDTLVRD